MKNLLVTFLIAVPFITTYPQDTINVPADYSTIQAGIDAATNSDIVLVADGTYYENINFSGKAVTVASRFLVDGDKSHIENTIIDGGSPPYPYPDSNSVVIFNSGEDTSSVICGFTITGGTGTANNSRKAGGGIYCNNAGGKICYNKIMGNVISGGGADGGGIYAYAQSNLYSIIIENNIIANNISNGNRGNATGGGIHFENLNGIILNNIIKGNIVGGWGAGGGGIYISECSPILVNNTIIDNEAYNGSGYPHSVGGIAVNSGTPIILNSIIWGNTDTFGNPSSIEADSAYVFDCDVEEGFVGIGNIDVYPEFVDTTNGDYHLADNSPCIGAGIDSIEVGGSWYYCPITDLEGNPRPNPLGTMPDMGAYESPLSVSGIEDYSSQVPKTYSLEQNYPNPFNPTTKIKFSIPQSSNVEIKVFDILGNEIETLINDEKPAGNYKLTWNASNLPSGVYFYQLNAGDYIETKKLVLMK